MHVMRPAIDDSAGSTTLYIEPVKDLPKNDSDIARVDLQQRLNHSVSTISHSSNTETLKKITN